VTAVVLFALAGASSILDAATSMQCDPDTSARCAQGEHTAFGLIGQLVNPHTDSGLLGFIGGAAGASVLGAVVAGRWAGWGRLQIALGIGIASCGLADIILLLASSSIGWTERIRVLLTSGWFLATGLFLLHEHIVSRRAPIPETVPDEVPKVKRRPARHGGLPCPAENSVYPQISATKLEDFEATDADRFLRNFVKVLSKHW